jgi:hypothetical protein
MFRAADGSHRTLVKETTLAPLSAVLFRGEGRSAKPTVTQNPHPQPFSLAEKGARQF